MDNILDLRKKNEEIAEKFGSIEERLASAETPARLFETWMTGMAEAFGIPFLWISIIADPRNMDLIRALRASSTLKDRLSVIDASTFTDILPNGVKPVLANHELRPFFRLLPRNKYFVKSVAVAPLILDGRVIGSLNHGDASPSRYEPGMDTNLLQSLATRLSARLSDMIP